MASREQVSRGARYGAMGEWISTPRTRPKIVGVILARDASSARAGIWAYQRHASCLGVALRTGLGDEVLIRTREARQPIQDLHKHHPHEGVQAIMGGNQRGVPGLCWWWRLWMGETC